jgi:uncharacterized protein (DUF169 family)
MANRRDVSVFSDILDHLTWYRMFESASVAAARFPALKAASVACVWRPLSRYHVQ